MNNDDNGLISRKIAYDILVEVLLKQNPLDQTLARHKDFNLADPRARNLARMIVATVLRRKIIMDALITKMQTKPQTMRPSNIYILLYIGMAQLLYMEVADHAAVDVTIRLVKMLKMERQVGLINALLRRTGREGRAFIDAPSALDHIPKWLRDQWVKDYGAEVAGQIAAASLAEAATDITLKNPDQADKWAEKLEADILPTGSLRLKASGGVMELEGFQEGDWWVQDASAALPARLFGDLTGKNVIDLCAAPGGKTAQLIAAGGSVTALDRAEKRMERLAENMIRLGYKLKVEPIVADGATWQPEVPVDAVLLDAPCSATGTIRRHPDVMHLKSVQDVSRLGELQAKLLVNAAEMLKSGGTLTYCTCSLQKSEGEAQVKAFLAAHKDFKREVIKPEEIGNLPQAITPNGDVRVLPHYNNGMDGFFVARLVKD